MSPAAKPAHTEAEMLAMLAKRYGATKQGVEAAYAFVPHVRNAASFDATRTADALAMGVWKSRGLLLHGFEVKCSRTDWLRELRDPAKADTGWARFCDRWWLVIAAPEVIQPGEVPEPWGILVAKGKALTEFRAASPLQPDALGRTQLAALLRAACTQSASRADLAVERQAGFEEARRIHEDAVTRTKAELEKARDVLRRFRDVTGVALSDDSWAGRKPEDVGALVRAVLNEERVLADAERRAHSAINALRSAAQAVLKLADELEVPSTAPDALLAGR